MFTVVELKFKFVYYNIICNEYEYGFHLSIFDYESEISSSSSTVYCSIYIRNEQCIINESGFIKKCVDL